MLDELQRHCVKKAMPPEIKRLGRTIKKWFDKLCNFHLARITNGPTESLNNLIKRIKRVGFGFRNFENYRIRALLYAGKPNWRVLGSIVNGFGDKVFHTVINRTIRFPDASVAGEPITTFDTSSMGASSYRELAKEVLERWRQTGDEHAG